MQCAVSGAKMHVQYVTMSLFLYVGRHVLLCFYYVGTGTYSGGSELKCPVSVIKRVNVNRF